MGKAFLSVDANLMRDLLHLPSDCEIVTSVEGSRGIVRVMVDHASIAEATVEVTAAFKRQDAIVFAGFEPVQRPPSERSAD